MRIAEHGHSPFSGLLSCREGASSITMAYPLRSARRFYVISQQHGLLAPINSDRINVISSVIHFRRYANGYNGPPSPSQILLQPEDIEQGSGPKDTVHSSRYAATAYKMFEAAATTFATLAVLGYVGQLLKYITVEGASYSRFDASSWQIYIKACPSSRYSDLATYASNVMNTSHIYN